MSVTLYHIFITALLALVMALLLGGGFAWGCRLSELDEPSEPDSRR